MVSGVRSSWVTEDTNAALRSDILRTLLSMKKQAMMARMAPSQARPMGPVM